MRTRSYYCFGSWGLLAGIVIFLFLPGCGQVTPNSPGSTLPGGGTHQIAFTSNRDGNAEIYLMRSDGKDQVNLSQDPEGDFCPDLSPDGTQVVFASYRTGFMEIYTMTSTGASPTKVYGTGWGYDPSNFPSWSMDGSELVFANFDTARLLEMPVPGAAVTLPYLGYQCFEPQWSPDGARIVFEGDLVWGESALVAVDADGSNPVTLTNVGARESSPAWSPDGTKIAFSSTRDGNPEIYVMNADGSNPTRLTNDPAGDYYPSWSPDGKYIAFTTDRDGNQEIYIMGKNGEMPRNLTKNPADDWYPSWR